MLQHALLGWRSAVLFCKHVYLGSNGEVYVCAHKLILLSMVSAGKSADAASSVELESDADESEDYQEDFEEEEAQAPSAAAQKKNGVQSGGSGAAGRKV